MSSRDLGEGKAGAGLGPRTAKPFAERRETGWSQLGRLCVSCHAVRMPRTPRKTAHRERARQTPSPGGVSAKQPKAGQRERLVDAMIELRPAQLPERQHRPCERPCRCFERDVLRAVQGQGRLPDRRVSAGGSPSAGRGAPERIGSRLVRGSSRHPSPPGVLPTRKRPRRRAPAVRRDPRRRAAYREDAPGRAWSLRAARAGVPGQYARTAAIRSTFRRSRSSVHSAASSPATCEPTTRTSYRRSPPTASPGSAPTRSRLGRLTGAPAPARASRRSPSGSGPRRRRDRPRPGGLPRGRHRLPAGAVARSQRMRII